MINRMDNICEAIIKGKWPSNRRQFFDMPGLLPGYGTMATDSPMPRRSMGDFSMMNQSSYSGSDDITMSPQVNKASLSLALSRSLDCTHAQSIIHPSLPPSHSISICPTMPRMPFINLVTLFSRVQTDGFC